MTAGGFPFGEGCLAAGDAFTAAGAAAGAAVGCEKAEDASAVVAASAAAVSCGSCSRSLRALLRASLTRRLRSALPPSPLASAGDAALAAVRSLADGPASAPDPALSALSWSALGLPADAELIPPHQCRALWRQFATDVEYAVLQARARYHRNRLNFLPVHGVSFRRLTRKQAPSHSLLSPFPPPSSQARTAQEAAERAAHSSVPLWALAAIVALGWNEVLWLLRHPVQLFLLAVLGLFGRAVATQIDFAGAMRLGVIPGLVLVFSKVVPAALVVVQKLVRGGAVLCVRVVSWPTGRLRSASLAPLFAALAWVSSLTDLIRRFCSWRRGRTRCRKLR